MAKAYGVFANGGYLIEPYIVDYISSFYQAAAIAVFPILSDIFLLARELMEPADERPRGVGVQIVHE